MTKKIITPGSPYFYIPKRNYVESFADQKVGVEGLYICRAIKPGIGVVRELCFPNLITDTGLDNLSWNATSTIGSSSWSRMHLGTGTTTPAFSDSALATFGKNVISNNGSDVRSNSGSSPYYGQLARTWTSSVGGATGNWTEIGISNQNTNGNLRSRALILDGGGSPTVFPVQADEQFQGTYILRFYVPLTDAPATITMSGTPYDTVCRALNATLSSGSPNTWSPLVGLISSNSQGGSIWRTGALAAITAASPAGSTINAGTMSVAASAYGAGNHYRDSSFRWGSGGSGALRTLMAPMDGASFQIEYDPVINKLTTEEVIHNQRISWARR